jgi:hypothetical protein
MEAANRTIRPNQYPPGGIRLVTIMKPPSDRVAGPDYAATAPHPVKPVAASVTLEDLAAPEADEDRRDAEEAVQALDEKGGSTLAEFRARPRRKT